MVLYCKYIIAGPLYWLGIVELSLEAAPDSWRLSKNNCLSIFTMGLRAAEFKATRRNAS